MAQPGGALALGATRTTGADVRAQNVAAVAAVANIVKSSLGPVGLDKVRESEGRRRDEMHLRVALCWGRDLAGDAAGQGAGQACSDRLESIRAPCAPRPAPAPLSLPALFTHPWDAC